MRLSRLIARNLTWYWRTNAAVVAGLAVTTAVLGGALLVGDSVRASLQRLAFERLGATQFVLSSLQLFREDLARQLAPAAPVITLEATARNDRTSALAAVTLYGVDDTFYRFHGARAESLPKLSPALARELGVKPGDSLILRFDEVSAIPRESLHGRRELPGRSLRITLDSSPVAASMSEFALRPQQGDVRAVFVPRASLARALGRPRTANTLLLRNAPDLKANFDLSDLGLQLEALDANRGVALTSAGTLLPDTVADRALEVARAKGLEASRLLTYLANGIRTGAREVPYSLVTALDERALAAVAGKPVDPGSIVLNDWAARDLNTQPGARVQLAYYFWTPQGGLETRHAEFTLAAVVPLRGLAADRDVAPRYPGITDADTLGAWDPPFPIDLKRVRPADEDYWKRYRTTPKAWLRIEDGQRLWGSRFGKLTSIRITPATPEFARWLHDAIDPLQAGLSLVDVRTAADQASAGSTDFGQYFLYFSFFVLLSALLLTMLFFRLGVEQRLSEIGLFQALGYSQSAIRRIFLVEGSILALAGALLGVLLSLAYAALILYGLRTWWIDAVGTRALTLAVSPAWLAAGAVAGIAAGLLAIVWALRSLSRHTPRSLLSGSAARKTSRRSTHIAVALLAIAILLLLLGSTKQITEEGAFFGAGTLLVAAGLFAFRSWLNASAFGPTTLSRFGIRNVGWRPGRSIAALALIASASFLLLALESFRPTDDRAGAGGYGLYAESRIPVFDNPDPAPHWVRFRLRPGDDVSCLNLYQPRNPRILGAPSEFLRQARFRFASSVRPSQNPWLLLEEDSGDGTIPAIVDQNSMLYILHKQLGDEVRIERTGAPPIRLRLAAALAGSLFQSELIISDRSFQMLFPEQEGFRVFLLDEPPDSAAKWEDALSDFGFDATPAVERVAAFHRIENTYISTFQALGALGLLLGTFGLGAILFRNALERRREFGLLRAFGYARADVMRLLLVETLFLLFAGLLLGATAALIAVAPSLSSRAAALPWQSVAGVVLVLVLAGTAATLAAVRAATRTPLLEALRTE